MDIELGRDFAIECLQELLELDRAMTACRRPITLPLVRSSAA